MLHHHKLCNTTRPRHDGVASRNRAFEMGSIRIVQTFSREYSHSAVFTLNRPDLWKFEVTSSYFAISFTGFIHEVHAFQLHVMMRHSTETLSMHLQETFKQRFGSYQIHIDFSAKWQLWITGPWIIDPLITGGEKEQAKIKSPYNGLWLDEW